MDEPVMVVECVSRPVAGQERTTGVGSCRAPPSMPVPRCDLPSTGTLDRVHCPHCPSADTRVIDSRSIDDGAATRRRRECVTCNRRFTTFERVEEPALIVVKRSGRREAFAAEKLIAG